jgi:hypothetical protein
MEPLRRQLYSTPVLQKLLLASHAVLVKSQALKMTTINSDRVDQCLTALYHRSQLLMAEMEFLWLHFASEPRYSAQLWSKLQELTRKLHCVNEEVERLTILYTDKEMIVGQVHAMPVHTKSFNEAGSI